MFTQALYLSEERGILMDVSKQSRVGKERESGSPSLSLFLWEGAQFKQKPASVVLMFRWSKDTEWQDSLAEKAEKTVRRISGIIQEF